MTDYVLKTRNFTIAIDFGSSLIRVLYVGDGLNESPKLITLPPYVIPVDESEIERIKEKQILENYKAETAAWFCADDRQYYLAGNLAETYSRSGRSLKPRKVFRAIPMTLAIVGAIAKNHVIKSDTKMNIKLGILLPWSEYKDRSKYEKRLSKALELEYLSFQDQLFNINLESFKCLPEGAGILQKGRAKKGKFWPPIGTVNILVPMLGYRNLSILLLKKGELIGDTTPYGMSWLIKQLQDDTSGYTEQQLIKAVCAAGANLNEKALTPLVRNIPKEYQQDELSCLTAAISRGRKAYTNLISNWIKSEIDFPLDEVVISGGTSHTFKPELLRLFKEEKNVTPTFAKGLEQRVIQHFKAQVRGNAMPSRLADLYGFFYYLKPAPLPALRQSEGVR